MSDKGPKSAFEIAMERLQRKDADEGVERRVLTDQQRQAIAEIRNAYSAKLAQEEIMHASALRRASDPAERTALDDAYRRDCERLTSERDAKIERIRRGEA
jgi:hypothetical protein